jgi:hypothetical protein
MSRQIDIAAGEAGRIRVFAIILPPEDVRQDLARMPASDLARRLLASPHLDTKSTEIFPVSDLSGVGLAAYLAEGYAVSQDAIAADRARLDALDGYVMLLFSDSFASAQATLTPGPDVNLIGTYEEFQPEGGGKPVRAESAKPYSGHPAKPAPAPSRSGIGSIVILLAIVIASGAALWVMLQ